MPKHPQLTVHTLDLIPRDVEVLQMLQMIHSRQAREPGERGVISNGDAFRRLVTLISPITGDLQVTDRGRYATQVADEIVIPGQGRAARRQSRSCVGLRHSLTRQPHLVPAETPSTSLRYPHLSQTSRFSSGAPNAARMVGPR